MPRGLFGPLMPVLEKGVDIAVMRQKLIASNIANEETPGYKTREINFQKELDKVLGSKSISNISMTTTNSSHFSTGSSAVSGVEIQIESGPGDGIDGNTVSLEKEMVKMAENKLRHDAAMTLLSKKFEGLKSAIIGGR
jgi:flagellar basal-body rod protein FlgB